MIRVFDFFFSSLGLIILSPLLVLIWIIGIFENGSPIFKQERLGYSQKLFLLFKYRTMQNDTKSVATHLINESNITSFGLFLRRTKLDEVPQLFNVFLGDMSLVGPRPCLSNQKKSYCGFNISRLCCGISSEILVTNNLGLSDMTDTLRVK